MICHDVELCSMISMACPCSVYVLMCCDICHYVKSGLSAGERSSCATSTSEAYIVVQYSTRVVEQRGVGVGIV